MALIFIAWIITECVRFPWLIFKATFPRAHTHTHRFRACALARQLRGVCTENTDRHTLSRRRSYRQRHTAMQFTCTFATRCWGPRRRS